MAILANTDRGYAKALRKVVTRSRSQGASVEKAVRVILQAVERGGDRAVLRYTKKFDRLSLRLDQVRVTPEEIKEAYYHIRKDEGDSLRYAADRVRQFHERQRTKTWMYQEQQATLGQMVTPLDAVGASDDVGKRGRGPKVETHRLGVICVEDPQCTDDSGCLDACRVAGEHQIGSEAPAMTDEVRHPARKFDSLPDQAARPGSPVNQVRDAVGVQQFQRHVLLPPHDENVVPGVDQPLVEVAIEMNVGGMGDVEQDAHGREPDSVGPTKCRPDPHDLASPALS